MGSESGYTMKRVNRGEAYTDTTGATVVLKVGGWAIFTPHGQIEPGMPGEKAGTAWALANTTSEMRSAQRACWAA